MTLVNADGSLVSKEVYKYDYDSMGNWVKMTTSVAVVENGRVGFEPTEVTYRTIFYYLDATMAKMLQASSASPSTASVAKTEASGQQSRPSASIGNEMKSGSSFNLTTNRSETKISAALPPPTSFDK